MVLTLDDLASDWLSPANEEHFSLPAIANCRGIVQAAWDVAGIQNWIFAPCGMNTPAALLFVHENGRWRRLCSERVSYRWKAYEIGRRGGGVETATRLVSQPNGVMQRLRFSIAGRMAIVFRGLPRVWRFTDYWNLPPEDVPQFNLRRAEGGFVLDDCKTFGRARVCAPGRLQVYTSLQQWLDGASPAPSTGRVGVAEFDVNAGDEIAWHGVIGTDETLDVIPDDQRPGVWERARTDWEATWQAAFTPNNPHFSGSLPTYQHAVAPHLRDGPSLERLYCMSILTLLMTRRFIPPPNPRTLIATGGQCIWTPPEAHGSGENNLPPERLSRAYVWGGPEGAPTTSFLWEVEFQAPLLARLDPGVLRAQLEAMMRVDLHRHWGIETVTGAGAGMGYGVNPGAFLSCAGDYVRLTGDRDWALQHLPYLKSCLRPELTDYGDCQNILECVSTYEHTIAAFNALAVQGLRFVAELTGQRELSSKADALAVRVRELFADGPFACVQPDGSRRIVKTILDFVYVGRSMTADLPDSVRRRMVDYFVRELQTKDWARALALSDPDALTKRLPAFQTYRADHQATGSYDGWPARAAGVLLRFGARKEAIRWLAGIQELTREGPFGQAHFIHDDDGDALGAGDHGFPSRTRKASFFNGNCYFESAGCGFATALLEDLAGG